MASEESYPKLISLAVHELRSPASVVSGYLRMLQRDTETPLSDRHLESHADRGLKAVGLQQRGFEPVPAAFGPDGEQYSFVGARW